MVMNRGVLSPVLLNMYDDSFIGKLMKRGTGFHLHGVYLGCIMYADDIIDFSFG